MGDASALNRLKLDGNRDLVLYGWPNGMLESGKRKATPSDLLLRREWTFGSFWVS